MLIFVQYSLADSRPFIEGVTPLLKKPSWPSPYPYKEFVKGSGQIIERKKGGLDNWIGENYICKINKGIRISNFEINHFHLKIKNISKHQFTSDGGVLSKYVFVFKITGYLEAITKDILEQIIDKLLNCKISIRSTNYKSIDSKFRNFIKDLKAFHIITTTKNGTHDIKQDSQFIKFCTPQIYFLLDGRETFANKWQQVKHVTKNETFPFKLFSYWQNYNNSPYKIWIHQKVTSSSLIELNRNLRISILRIHAEFECLNFVLSDISNGKLQVKEKSTDSSRLQYYISNAITSILKQRNKVEEKIGVKNSIEYFKEIFYQFQPGDYETLVKRIKQIDFRPQVEQKALVFIENLYSQNLEFMKNKFTNSQIGAVGENATAENNQFLQQNYNIPSDTDYSKLVEELARLKRHIENEPDIPFKEMILENVEEAKQEAEKKNVGGVIKFLKSGGKWLLDTATKIGINLVTDLIKSNFPK